VKTKEYLFIDEGQFFEDLDMVIYWSLMGKTITIAALDADSNQCLWPTIQRIMPYCLYGQQTACCDICGHANATLSIAVDNSKQSTSTNDKSNIKIGGKESFIAMCVHCKYTQQK
jgi:thymidine kinase